MIQLCASFCFNARVSVALTVAFSLGPVTAARGDEAPSLPAEVRQIQQALGGPAVDQFQELRPAAPDKDEVRGRRPDNAPPPGAWGNWTTSPGPWNAASMTPAPPDRRTVAQVAALREAAAQLDGSANRLESLDLYPQADAMRGLAQRLRLGARDMVGGRQTAADRPALLNQLSQPHDRPATAPSLGRSAQPAPTHEPTPADSN